MMDSRLDGQLTITLTSDSVTSFDDGSYFVTVDGEEVEFTQIGKRLTIDFMANSQEIMIFGEGYKSSGHDDKDAKHEAMMAAKADEKAAANKAAADKAAADKAAADKAAADKAAANKQQQQTKQQQTKPSSRQSRQQPKQQQTKQQQTKQQQTKQQQTKPQQPLKLQCLSQLNL